MRPGPGWPDPRRGKAVDNGGLRYGAMEGVLRPPLHTATQSALRNPTILLRPRRPKTQARLTKPPRRNIIASIRGSKRRVADIKSEARPASDRNRWPASFWNAWPASSESAVDVVGLPSFAESPTIARTTLNRTHFNLVEP